MPSGLFYAYADFVSRLLPSGSEVDTRFVHEVLDGLKRLGQAAEHNPRITLLVTITGGVWILHKGRRKLFINPAQKFLRVETPYGVPQEAAEFAAFIEPVTSSGLVRKSKRAHLDQWPVPISALDWVWKYVECLSAPSTSELEEQRKASNPRYFKQDDKSAALITFEREGRWCNGVEGVRNRHKLKAGEPVEYDNWLPHSRGGSSSIRNLQILCAEYNRIKGDKLL